MREIYVVTEGYYSDHHSVAVCSTREKAEALVAKLKELGGYLSNETEIDVFELDTIADNLDAQWWYISMDAEGNTIQAHECKLPLESYRDRLTYFRGGNFYTHVTAEHVNRAIKVASDRRFRLLAENQ